jgi:hypothetical protein
MRYNMRLKTGQLLIAKDTGQDKDGISRQQVQKGLTLRFAQFPIFGHSIKCFHLGQKKRFRTRYRQQRHAVDAAVFSDEKQIPGCHHAVPGGRFL